jgi:hypothetical protein
MYGRHHIHSRVWFGLAVDMFAEWLIKLTCLDPNVVSFWNWLRSGSDKPREWLFFCAAREDRIAYCPTNLAHQLIQNPPMRSAPGNLSAILTGPFGTDYDLYLQTRDSRGRWSTILQQTGDTSREILPVTYLGVGGFATLHCW